jgi:hypothetical protein
MRATAAFGALVLATVIVAAAPAQVERTPRLSVVSEQPLVVAGGGFVVRERVVVTALTSLGPRVARVRASAAGTFRARFAPFTQPCGRPFAVRARGSAGSVATVRLAGRPCVPPPID